MVYALHNLFLLLLPFFIHGCRSWYPDCVNYLCPDFNGTSLVFRFTNSSLLVCGYCILECENGSPKAKCGRQKLSYKIKQIFPDNNTIILSYPGLNNLIADVCRVDQNDSAIIPDPPCTSFGISHPDVYFRCPRSPSEHNSASGKTCGNDILYGPCSNPEHPQDEGFNFQPGCSRIELPRSVHDDNFSVRYEFPEECSEYPADRSRCLDTKTRSIQCPKKVQNAAKGRRRLKIILGTVLPGSLLIFLAILILFFRGRKTKEASSAFPSTSIALYRRRSSLDGVTVFSYSELEDATNGFATDRELGEGGFGIVYHGKLGDGREIAVKRLYQKNYKRIEQFNNEIQILTSLHHKNLVTLYGCTSRHSQGPLLLVYEYVPNGTVADHLHGDLSGLMSWSTRMNIAIETAQALSYLHQRNIIHRDVKTNNILLDNSFSIKVADFGLSRLFPADVSHVSTAPQGTPGYLDPVYHHCYHLTEKSDVYSFGVVLVELISSLPAVDVGRDRDEINLSNYAMKKIIRGAFSELVDQKLNYERDFKVRGMTNMVGELAFQCLQQEREHRPTMDEVLQALKRILSLDCDALEEEVKNVMNGTTEVISSSPNYVMDIYR